MGRELYMGYWIQSRQVFSTVQVQIALLVLTVISVGALLAYYAYTLSR